MKNLCSNFKYNFFTRAVILGAFLTMPFGVFAYSNSEYLSIIKENVQEIVMVKKEKKQDKQNFERNSKKKFITSMSIVCNGSTKHFIKGDFYENNNIKGIEISTNISDPILNYFDIDSKFSFRGRSFVNSFEKDSQSLGVESKACSKGLQISSFGEIKLCAGYDVGLVWGYGHPSISLPNGERIEFRTPVIPYALGALGIKLTPFPEKFPAYVEVETLHAIVASGVELKLGYDFRF